MANNNWLGIAQSTAERRVLVPRNITPGSVWQLRVGSRTYSYTYPSTIEVAGLTDLEKGQTVVDGILDAYTGGGAFGGGTDATALTISSDLYQGQWALLAIGPSDGTPIDVTLLGKDPTSARVDVTELQKGNALRSQVQRVKWPQTPTGGNARWRYRDVEVVLAYNANAAAVQTALEGITAIGSGNVVVSGSHSTEYTISFQGALAGKTLDKLYVYSSDSTGTAAFSYEVLSSPVLDRQTYVMDELNGDAGSVYRFEYAGDQGGHLFTGAADAAAIALALSSVTAIGAGNSTVVQQENGSYLITMVGKFVGVSSVGLTIVPQGNSPIVGLVGDAPDTISLTTRVRITFLNMPTDGVFQLSSNGSLTADINWLSTAGQITTALTTGGSDFIGWSCASSAGGVGDAWVIELLFSSSVPSLILPVVTGLLGTRAIDVSISQAALVARNEIQQLSIATDPTGGTFTLTFGANTTAAQAYNVSAATLQTALTGLASIGGGNASVSGPNGGPWLVEFIGSKAAADQAIITGNGASLTLAAVAAVTAVQTAVPTGPNWYNNAANWSLGNVPATTDVAVYADGAVPCKYGLSGNPAFAGMDVYRTYEGAIGLKSIRDDLSPETLPTDLVLTDNAGVFLLRIGLGDEGNGPSVVRIAPGAGQNVQATVLYGAQTTSGYGCVLSGLLDDLIVGNASVGIAMTPGTTATVGKLRVKPPQSDNATVEWSEQATVDAVQLQKGTLRAGSVPKSLFVTGGEATIRGTGTINALTVRNALVRWLAGGGIGKQGLFTALALDGSNQALLTSNAHGLLSGARVFVKGFVGVVGIPDGFYTVSVASANTFALVGTAPTIPFGASTPSTVASYYQTGTASWGLADAVEIGEEGIIDMSELAVLRTIVAPIVLQSATAQLIDPLVTSKSLRLRHDPGPAEETLGVGCVLMRDEKAAATAVPGNPGGAGGLAAA